MAENLEEKRSHSSEYIPFSYYESRIPNYFPNVPLHCHKEFEINHILSGQGEFTVGSEKFIAKEGDIIIIQPNVLHAVRPYKAYVQKYDTIVFAPSMLVGTERSSLDYLIPLSNNSIRITARITECHSRYNDLALYIHEVMLNARKNTSLNDLFLKGALYCFFSILLENGDYQTISTKNALCSDRINLSVEYINEHFTEKLTIRQLADISLLSSSYFMSSFKRYAGIGAIEYVNQIRIRKACELLKSGGGNISEIAFSCGFTNLSNFNRQFRRQIGLSPKEYSKAHLFSPNSIY